MKWIGDGEYGGAGMNRFAPYCSDIGAKRAYYVDEIDENVGEGWGSRTGSLRSWPFGSWPGFEEEVTLVVGQLHQHTRIRVKKNRESLH